MARPHGPTTEEQAEIDERDALTVADLRKLLPAGIGRTGAYQIARKLGVRVGRRRLLISRARFDKWLAGERGGGRSGDAA